MEHSGRVAREALHACVRLQRSAVQWRAGLRTGVLITITLLIGLGAGRLEAALSVAIGLLFVAIADCIDSRGVRLRTMLWATLWVGIGVLLGGLVGDFGAVHVVVAIILALACGYAGALGPRGGLIGVLTLVLFAFYAGAPVVVDDALLDTALFALGGLITIAVNLLLSPPRRLGAVRAAIAHAYRELQDAATRRGVELAAPTVAGAVMTARTVVSHEGCVGETAAWAERLLSDAERTRRALLALLSERHIDADYVDRLCTALAHASRAIADEISAPPGLSSRGRGRSRVALGAVHALVDQAPDPRLAALAGSIAEPLADAVASLDGPWPIGRRARIEHPPLPRAAILPRLRAHLSLSGPIAEHAIRLTIAFGGATLASVIVGVSHAYWVPLTVAWVAKPDLSSTVSRVTMRIIGTILGLITVSVLLLAVHGLPDARIVLVVAVGATGALALAYLSANYPLAVLGITSFVLLVEYLSGDDARYDVVARLVATVIGGLWVLLVASIRPRRGSSQALAALRATVVALGEYAAAVRTGVGVDTARSRVLAERTAALTAVSAATLETRGLWERPGERVDPDRAAVILTDIITATSSILAEELLEDAGQADPLLWERIDSALDDLDARVSALSAPPRDSG